MRTKQYAHVTDIKPNFQNKAQSAAEALRRKYNHYNLQLFVEMGEKRLQTEGHEKRVAALRKELDDLKSTEWQYDQIEKYIGQA